MAMITGFTPAAFNIIAMLAGLRVGRWAQVAVLAWLAVMIAVLATMHIRLRRQLRREFEAAAGRLCTHCAYNLKDLPPTGGCPECGHEYDAEFDARTWHGAGFEMPEQVAPSPSPPS
jgi:hypothetical protein